MLKIAYRVGVQAALEESGLIKKGDEGGSIAWPMLAGPIGGAIAAPEGKGWEAAGKTMVGQGLGSLAGGLGGGGLGLLLALLSRGKIRPEVAGLAGGAAGSLAGSLGGAAMGYRSAVPE